MEDKRYVAYFEGQILCDPLSLEMAKMVAHDKLLKEEIENEDAYLGIWVRNVDDYTDSYYYSKTNKKFMCYIYENNYD